MMQVAWVLSWCKSPGRDPTAAFELAGEQGKRELRHQVAPGLATAVDAPLQMSVRLVTNPRKVVLSAFAPEEVRVTGCDGRL